MARTAFPRIHLSALMVFLTLIAGTWAPASFAGSEYPEASRFAGRQLRKVDLLTTTGGKASLAPERGKSVVLIPVFTSCPVTCPTILKDFEAALRESRTELAKAKFEVFVVSFDPLDTVGSFKSLVARQKLPRQWIYAVPAPGRNFGEFEALLADLDFRYRKLPGNAGGFAHPAGAYIFDDMGTVRRFLAQAEFTKEDIVDGIVGRNNTGSGSPGKRGAKYSGGVPAGSHTEHMDHR